MPKGYKSDGTKLGFQKDHKESEETRQKRIKALTGRKLSPEHLQKLKESKNITHKGEKHPNWKGGRMLQDGYVYIRNPDHPNAIKGYVAEHRLVIFNQLKRPLETWEQVHHKNGNREDNREENLELVISKKHRGDMRCPYCLKHFWIR